MRTVKNIKSTTSELEQGIREFLSTHSNLSENSIPSHINIYKKLLLTGDPGYQKISKDRVDTFLTFMNKFGKNTKDKKASPVLNHGNVQKLDKIENIFFRFLTDKEKEETVCASHLFKEYAITLFGMPRKQVSDRLNDFYNFANWCALEQNEAVFGGRIVFCKVYDVIFDTYENYLKKEKNNKADTAWVKTSHIRAVFKWAESNNKEIVRSWKYKVRGIPFKTKENNQKDTSSSTSNTSEDSVIKEPLKNTQKERKNKSDALVKSTYKTKENNGNKYYKLSDEQEEKIEIFLNENHTLSEKSKINMRTAYRKLLCTGETWKYITKDKRELFLSYMGKKDKKPEEVLNNKIPIMDLAQKEENKITESFYTNVKSFLDVFTYRNRHLSESLKNRLLHFITCKFTGDLEKDKSIIKSFNDEEYSFYEEYSHIIDSCFRELEHRNNFIIPVQEAKENKEDRVVEEKEADTMVGILKEKLESLSNKLGDLVEEINTIRLALKYM